jgi:hypothetical protein
MGRHKTPFTPQSEYEKVKAKYGLTFKQYVFANNYIKSGNGLQSARLAGYKGNQNTLGVMANENLHKEAIIKYIDDVRLNLNSKPSVIPDNNTPGTDVNTNQPNITVADISNNGINSTTRAITEIIDRYWDLVNNSPQDNVRRAALSDLAKIYGGFAPQKLEVQTMNSISDEMEKARKRLADINISVSNVR